MAKKTKNREPRKLDILANEKFDGNIRKTIDYLLKEQPSDLCDYTQEMDSYEATYASNVLYDMAEEEHGEGYMARLIDLTCSLERLGMTQQELVATEHNPYGAQIKKIILMVSATVVLVGVVLGVLSKTIENTTITTLVGVAGAVVVSTNVLKLSGCIMAYANFSRAKRLVKEMDKYKNEE